MHLVLAVSSDIHGIYVLAAGTVVAALIIALLTLSARFLMKLNRIIDRYFRVDPDDPEANLPGMVRKLTHDDIPNLVDQLGDLADAVRGLKDSHRDITRRLDGQDQVLARIVGGVQAVDQAVHDQNEEGS